jgi:bifunctional non-homologous end joining protein LigD
MAMLFDTFATGLKEIDSLRTKRSRRNGFVEFLSGAFPWPPATASGQNNISDQRPEEAQKSNFDSKEESILEELIAAIYLCQGHIAVSYRKRRMGKRSYRQVLTEFQSIRSKHKDRLVSDVYKCLNGMADQIETWLNNKERIPAQLVDLVTEMDIVERDRLARILAGPWYHEEWLIGFLATHYSAGIGAPRKIEEVYRTTLPDLGLIARLLWMGRSDGFWNLVTSAPHPGLPLKPEKINRFDSPDLAWPHTGPCYVQPKYDGWQIQIHKYGDKIWLFGRDQEELTEQFPEVVEACRVQLTPASVILDCEIIGIDTQSNRVLSFEETLMASRHRAIVFDILLLDGKDFRREPYSSRRTQLLKLLPIDDVLTISSVEETFVTTQKQLQDVFERWAADERFEGIVVKRGDKRYSVAGKSDGKWKIKNYLSLDLVVLGYRVSPKGLPMLLAGAWDEKLERLVPVGQVPGNRISPKYAETVLSICKSLAVESKPSVVAPSVTPRVWMEPKMVIEVRTNGLRVRDTDYFNADCSRLDTDDLTTFRARPDKSPEDTDPLSEFLALRMAPGHR